jgi:hypothetical protein
MLMDVDRRVSEAFYTAGRARGNCDKPLPVGPWPALKANPVKSGSQPIFYPRPPV